MIIQIASNFIQPNVRSLCRTSVLLHSIPFFDIDVYVNLLSWRNSELISVNLFFFFNVDLHKGLALTWQCDEASEGNHTTLLGRIEIEFLNPGFGGSAGVVSVDEEIMRYVRRWMEFEDINLNVLFVGSRWFQ